VIDRSMQGKVKVTVIATGFNRDDVRVPVVHRRVERVDPMQRTPMPVPDPDDISPGRVASKSFFRRGKGQEMELEPSDQGFTPNFSKLKDDLDVPAFPPEADGLESAAGGIVAVREGWRDVTIVTATRILVVDDDPGTARLVREWYRGQPFEILEAGDGEEGVRLAVAERPDIILMDLVMPRTNGFDAARRLKSDPTTSSIPVILVSAQRESKSKRDGFDAGADDYVTKPFDFEEVDARIRAMLRKRELYLTLESRNQELKASNDQLEELATVDELTGSPTTASSRSGSRTSGSALCVTRHPYPWSCSTSTTSSASTTRWDIPPATGSCASSRCSWPAARAPPTCRRATAAKSSRSSFRIPGVSARRGSRSASARRSPTSSSSTARHRFASRCRREWRRTRRPRASAPRTSS
jgi:DNA-binding response OmpR family regulator